ncbi:hypothetical protein [Microbulbifer sp. PAAF003]|uniref:hypothetical protein n=1 Tax=Microbulbifer sp. PAAF003 TaxID=3243375 RepID=UPI0040394CE6
MILKKSMKVAAIFAALLVVNVQAKTFKYEVQDARVSNFGLYHLPFGNDINSVVLTVDVEHPESDSASASVSLEIDFIEAAKLVVKKFRLHEYHWGGAAGNYRGSVNNAWVYRQLNFEIPHLEPLYSHFDDFEFIAFVSESDSFTGAGRSDELGEPLFEISGRLIDVTPSKIVDVEKLKVNDSTLKLSLRNHISGLPTSRDSGIIIDSLWFGKGEAQLVIPSEWVYDFYMKPVDLIISKDAGSEIDEYFVSVRAINQDGEEFISDTLPLQQLLNDAYGDASSL